MFYILLAVMVAFTVYRMMGSGKRGTKNKELMDILDSIDEEAVFYERANHFIETDQDEEYIEKIKILRLWADTLYEHDDAFLEHLADLDMNVFLNTGKKDAGFNTNEDSFFYMYLSLPNHLYYLNKKELREAVEAKMQEYDAIPDTSLLKKLSETFRDYYNQTNDHGKTFCRALLEGDYPGYVYSKQLIGIYKFCAAGILARIALDENDTESFEGLLDDLKAMSASRLGERWLKELDIKLLEEPKEAEGQEEAGEQE